MRAIRQSVTSDVRAAAAPRVQTKLRVSTPGDADEREADRIADLLVSTSHSDLQPHAIGEGVQRACCSSCSGGDCQEKKEETEKPLHLSAVPNAVPSLAVSSFEPILSGLRGGGEPLPLPQRRFFENRLRHDFGAVRVHHDPPAAGIAQRLGARAFTFGNDIGFAGGEYAPHQTDGLRLLGHELTHVLQQRLGGLALRRKPGGGQDPRALPRTHIDFDEATGQARLYVDDALVMNARFSGGAGGMKVDTKFDESGTLKIAVSVTPGAEFELVNDGLMQLGAKYPKLKFNATDMVQQLPEPEPILIFNDPEFNPPPTREPRPEPVRPQEATPVPDEGVWSSVGEWVHGSLDIVGFIPGVGEIADGINAVVYLAEGRYAEAAISAAAMIPIVGDAGKIGKWTVKAGKEIAEAGTESLAKQSAKETVQQVEQEVVEREAKEVAEEGAEGAAKKADEVAPDPACVPRPVYPHKGGNAIHDRCADARNIYPGADVLVKGKHFDALSPMRILWEVKTERFSQYSPFLKDITIAREAPEAVSEMGIALSCRFGFMLGLSDPEHRDALMAVIPFVPMTLVNC